MNAREMKRRIGPGSAPARLLVPALASALGTTAAASISEGYARWRAATARWGRPAWWDRPARLVPGLAGWAARLLPDGIDLPVRTLHFACETYVALAATIAPVVCLRGAGALTAGSLRLRMIDLEEGEPPLPGLVGGPIDDVFGWPTAAWQDEIDAGVRALIGALGPLSGTGPATGDLLGPTAAAFLPAKLKRRLGAYYTPDDLTARVVEMALEGDPPASICDPACGSGAFVVAATAALRRRFAERGVPRSRLAASVLDAVSAADLSPLAVRLARSNLIFALADVLPGSTEPRPVRVARADAILGPPGEPVDAVVGNPPWANWESLPPSVRERTRPLWQRYGLFSHDGMGAILGSAKKDLSMLAFVRLADLCVRPGGRIAMVLPRAVLQSGRTGDGFRRLTLPDGSPLGPLRVEDWTPRRPFGSRVPAIVLTCEKGRPVEFPVPWDRAEEDGSVTKLSARPVDPGDPASPWIVIAPGAGAAIAKLLGTSAYAAHAGAYSGGANGVYWLTCEGEPTGPTVRIRNETKAARRAVPSVSAEIETDLLVPLLRSRDVTAWAAEPSGWMLLPQSQRPRRGIDESEMRARYPKTLAYLARFRETLAGRPAFKRFYKGQGPWWAVFDVGDYTFSEWKVVWRQIGGDLAAAVVGPVGKKPVVPQHTVSLIAVESETEAHFVCGLLNAGPLAAALAAFSSAGTKGFGTPSAVARLNIPRFDPADPLHHAIAENAESIARARRLLKKDTDSHSSLTRNAIKLWNLSTDDVTALFISP